MTALKRYAQAVDVKAYGTTEPDASTVAQMLKESDARVITTEYDLLGRAVKVTQPTVWVCNGMGQSYFGAAVVEYTYDAFGQAVEVKSLEDQTTDTWATTTHYFDRRGQEVATIDAMGFVSTQDYDAAGNVTKRVEYANPSAFWTAARGFAVPQGSEDDRTTGWAYDKLNRKVSETRVNVEYSDESDGSSTHGDLTTRYGYNAVGNLTSTTDALQHVTYYYYDALGRTTAVSAPTGYHESSDFPQEFRTLTLFKRDAYGNVVAQIEFAHGAAHAGEDGFVAYPVGKDDRETLSAYDALGHVKQTTDAEGNSSFHSYDAAGRLAHQWRTVTSDDGIAGQRLQHTLYTYFEYDALGQQTAIITPASTSMLDDTGQVSIVDQSAAGSIRTVMEYNAYGEMVKRCTTGNGAPESNTEYFDYDQAGRLWRTNSGDGNVKVNLFDQLGRQTSLITSAGSAGTSDPGVNLGAFGSAQQVDQLDPSLLRRTDNELDLLGRVLKETLPTRGDVWNPGDDWPDSRPVIFQTFDRWGNVLTQSDVRNADWITTFRYNANNQVVTEVQPQVAVREPDGSIENTSPTTQTYYDALGRQVAVRDARGNVNGQTWDAGGLLSEEIHADGKTVVHRYDIFGDQVGLQDADQHVTTYEYDKMGRNTKIHSGLVQVYTAAL